MVEALSELVYPTRMQRDTRQRKVLRHVLAHADRPLSPHEILEAAKSEMPSLGIATVYRNVKSMVEDGALQTVEIPGEGLRYELAGKGHHHHFYCRVCSRVFEVEGCPGDVKGLAPDHFHVESHLLVLYGLCPTCQGADAGPAPRSGCC